MLKKLLHFLLIITFLTACKSNHSLASTSSTKRKLEKSYRHYKGTRYKYGGTTARGFDCSGFVQRIYKEAFNINLPRTTKAMMKIGKPVRKNNLKTGDLVFFHTSRKYYHVGIYLENGIFMHASTSKGVTKSSLNLKYWKRSYLKARRILKKS